MMTTMMMMMMTTMMMMMTMTMVKNLENLIPAHNHFLLQSSALLRSLFLRLRLVAETLSISNCRIFRVCLPSFFFKEIYHPKIRDHPKSGRSSFRFFLLAKAVPFCYNTNEEFPWWLEAKSTPNLMEVVSSDAKPHHEDVVSLRASFAVQKQGNDPNFAPEESEWAQSHQL